MRRSQFFRFITGLACFMAVASAALPARAASAPAVAVLDSRLTRRFMPNPDFYSWEMEGAFRTLRDLRVSYSVIGDEDLTAEKLKPYRLLILPGAKNISTRHAENIREFIRAGGKLLASGFASYRDEHDNSPTLRNNFQLSDLFGADFLRYNPIPPYAGFIRLAEIGEDRVELGRNSSIQIRPHPGAEVLGVWLNDDGKTLSAPESMDAAVVENREQNCIYAGENLFAPENSASLAVRKLAAALLNRLEPGTSVFPKPGPVALPGLPHLLSPPLKASLGPDIEVRLPFSPQSGFVTSDGSFAVFSGSRRIGIAARPFWHIGFQAEGGRGFRAASWTGSRFLFVPRGSGSPLKVVLWRSGGAPGSPFKFIALRGSVILKYRAGKFILVNRLPLEDYLAGVVSHEVPFYFHPAALQAMAVVARTAAVRFLEEKKFRDYDICATVRCQAYEGLAYESPSSRAAVSATSGEITAYRGHPADVPYAATCGGVTEDVNRVWNVPPAPYLRSVVDGEKPIRQDLSSDAGVEDFLLHPPDSFCRFSSRFRWKETYTRPEMEALFKTSLPVLLKRPADFDRLLDVRAAGRTMHGRVAALQIATDRGTWSVPADKIRWLFSGGEVGLGGLQSTLFVILEKKDAAGNLESASFLGGGWGHGAGLCQFGAEGMARRGFTARQILFHYFPGTAVAKWGRRSFFPGAPKTGRGQSRTTAVR